MSKKGETEIQCSNLMKYYVTIIQSLLGPASVGGKRPENEIQIQCDNILIANMYIVLNFRTESALRTLHMKMGKNISGNR